MSEHKTEGRKPSLVIPEVDDGVVGDNPHEVKVETCTPVTTASSSSSSSSTSSTVVEEEPMPNDGLFRPKTLADTQAEVKKHDKVMMYFTSNWCGPCPRILPAVKRLMAEHKDIFLVVVDVDRIKDALSAYEVRSLPTFHFFKNGVAQTALTLTTSKEDELAKRIKQFS